MIWTICFTVALSAIVVSILLFFRQYKGKKTRFSDAVKMLIIGFAAGVFVLMLPVQLDAFGSGASGITRAILMSMNKAIRAFFLTEINFMPKDASIDAGMYGVYSATLMLVCFLCPFLTLGFVLSFFSKVRAAVMFLFSRGKDLCVFSQLNESSLALAQDLHKNHPRRRMIFCDVDDAFKKQNSKMINETEKIGAICIDKEIQTLNLKLHSKKKKIWLFTISSDQQKNTNDALELIALYRDRNHTRVYLFSDLPESHMILSGIDPGEVKIRRIDQRRCLIYRFLYDQGELLFRGAAEDEENGKTISAVIVGMGDSGREMLKALSWYCQLDGYRLIIDAFDRDQKAEDLFRAECPDLLDPRYNGTVVAGEAAYTIRIHPGVDVRSADFYAYLKKIEHPTFAFVSIGGDSDNIEVSAELRTYFERCGVKPDIYTILKSSDKKDMIEYVENFKGQKYEIHSIGDIRSTFTENKIINSELEEEALRLHLLWGEEESFWRYEYNYQSSLARAIHLKMRRVLLPAATTEQQKRENSITEHKRWNAYMRSLGYIYSGSTDPSTRNDLAKLHNDLIPYEGLTEGEKKKDYDA